MQKVILSKEYLQGMEQFENCHLQAYVDCAGYPTIGIGHLIRPSEVGKYLGGMSIADAVKLWNTDREKFVSIMPKFSLDAVHDLKRKDCQSTIAAVESRLEKWNLSDVPSRCLEVAHDLAFNSGPGALDIGFREALLEKDWDGAVLFSAQYCLAQDPHVKVKKSVPFSGLTFRRYSFIWYYFTGQFWRIGSEGGHEKDWAEVNLFLAKLTELLKKKGKKNPLPYPNNRREAQKY